MPNFIALGMYFLFGTKFSWNECFNVEDVLLGRNFDFPGGYRSLPSDCYWLLLVTWWLLIVNVVTARYRSLLLVLTFSRNGSFTWTALFNNTSGSNWYICFNFCIIIYSFVCQLPALLLILI